MPPRKTHETFLYEVYQKVGNEYTVLGQYNLNKIPIEFKHNTCGKTFERTPMAFLKRPKCPHCFIVTRGKKYNEMVKNY